MLVEDDPQMREQLSSMIADSSDCELVCAAKDCSEALDFLQRGTFDVFLTDLQLPDGSGIDLIKASNRLHPKAEVMVITVFGDEANVFQALENGASGYLLKDSMPEDFMESINLLFRGGAPINPIIARKIINTLKKVPHLNPGDKNTPSLTEREIEILNLVARGFSISEVANLLQLSSHTVVSHVRKIYKKLRVNSRAEAICEAQLLGVLS